jgi:hypothetical protein
MSKKASSNELSTAEQYYLQVFHLFVAIHKRIWPHPTVYYNSAGGLAAVVITLLECLNIYTLLKYVIFPASRGCAACQYDVRLTILGLIGAALFVVNMVTFFGEELKQLPKPAHFKVFKRIVLGYIVLSILLAQ